MEKPVAEFDSHEGIDEDDDEDYKDAKADEAYEVLTNAFRSSVDTLDNAKLATLLEQLLGSSLADQVTGEDFDFDSLSDSDKHELMTIVSEKCGFIDLWGLDKKLSIVRTPQQDQQQHRQQQNDLATPLPLRQQQNDFARPLPLGEDVFTFPDMSLDMEDMVLSPSKFMWQHFQAEENLYAAVEWKRKVALAPDSKNQEVKREFWEKRESFLSQLEQLGYRLYVRTQNPRNMSSEQLQAMQQRLKEEAEGEQASHHHMRTSDYLKLVMLKRGRDEEEEEDDGEEEEEEEKKEEENEEDNETEPNRIVSEILQNKDMGPPAEKLLERFPKLKHRPELLLGMVKNWKAAVRSVCDNKSIDDCIAWLEISNVDKVKLEEIAADKVKLEEESTSKKRALRDGHKVKLKEKEVRQRLVSMLLEVLSVHAVTEEFAEQIKILERRLQQKDPLLDQSVAAAARRRLEWFQAKRAKQEANAAAKAKTRKRTTEAAREPKSPSQKKRSKTDKRAPETKALTCNTTASKSVSGAKPIEAAREPKSPSQKKRSKTDETASVTKGLTCSTTASKSKSGAKPVEAAQEPRSPSQKKRSKTDETQKGPLLHQTSTIAVD
eukprot:TRINITY_DN14390_c0_g1_i4.p1 TRINITY_DN14390_c0_g1~~TRINITY_DN14390_c0_g1_i4.p1  ORF type:complete len:686 (-),score=216.59 TRINITY_DN14390_c0_g1_i4:702-2516(-)